SRSFQDYYGLFLGDCTFQLFHTCRADILRNRRRFLILHCWSEQVSSGKC
ncbi:hypothetical protein GE061_009966, partial [Apolygus lucorum]